MTRPMTMAEKILAAHAGLDEVEPGQLIECDLDLVLANDITAPIAIKTVREITDRVFDPTKIALVPDHYTPNKDIKSAEQAKIVRDFVREQGITHYYEVGCMGVEHALLPEQGVVGAGDLIIGADSHTCTYGALGAFSTGVGSTDAGVGMATGKAWFKVPETIKVVIEGELPANVMSKDIILRLIGDLGADGATYKALEFFGSTVDNMSAASRMTMSNMAVEAGAKCALFTPDEKTAKYCDIELNDYQKSLKGDADAVYVRTLTYRAEDFVPVMACPSQVDKIRDVSTLEGIPIDQVFIGSCTNGRLEDLAAAAEVLKGQKVADYVKLIVTPASRKIYKQAMDLGIMETLAEAGAIITHPGCGLCCGRTGGILSDGERVVATNNRNFLGRMGTSKVEIFLASPRTAAACAVAGKIVTPK